MTTKMPESLAERYDQCSAKELHDQMERRGYVARYNRWSQLKLFFCEGGPSHCRPSTPLVERYCGTFRSLAAAHYYVFADVAEAMVGELLLEDWEPDDE